MEQKECAAICVPLVACSLAAERFTGSSKVNMNLWLNILLTEEVAAVTVATETQASPAQSSAGREE